MSFQFFCPLGHMLEGDPSQAGQPCRCPYCGAQFVVPQFLPGGRADAPASPRLGEVPLPPFQPPPGIAHPATPRGGELPLAPFQPPPGVAHPAAMSPMGPMGPMGPMMPVAPVSGIPMGPRAALELPPCSRLAPACRQRQPRRPSRHSSPAASPCPSIRWPRRRSPSSCPIWRTGRLPSGRCRVHRLGPRRPRRRRPPCPRGVPAPALASGRALGVGGAGDARGTSRPRTIARCRAGPVERHRNAGRSAAAHPLPRGPYPGGGARHPWQGSALSLLPQAFLPVWEKSLEYRHEKAKQRIARRPNSAASG